MTAFNNNSFAADFCLQCLLCQLDAAGRTKNLQVVEVQRECRFMLSKGELDTCSAPGKLLPHGIT